MGNLKKHIGGIALEALQMRGLPNDAASFDTSYYWITTIEFKDVNGSKRNRIKTARGGQYGAVNVLNAINYFSPYSNQGSFYATEEAESDYDVEAYAVGSSFGSTSWSGLRKIDDINHCATFTRVIAIQNTGNVDKTLRCLKFTKSVTADYSTSSQTGSEAQVDILLFSYYLTNPITIAPGDVAYITIKMEVGPET